MKSIKYILMALLAVTSHVRAFMQTHDHPGATASKTETMNVSGNCDMCKARIEKAAKLEGVFRAEWDKGTKVLTLVYDPSVVTSESVQKKIAAAGHDTDRFRADDKVYNNLPGCCHYERKK